MPVFVVERNIGPHKRGDIVRGKIDAFWDSHIKAGNVTLLDDPKPKPRPKLKAVKSPVDKPVDTKPIEEDTDGVQ